MKPRLTPFSTCPRKSETLNAKEVELHLAALDYFTNLSSVFFWKPLFKGFLEGDISAIPRLRLLFKARFHQWPKKEEEHSFGIPSPTGQEATRAPYSGFALNMMSLSEPA